MIEVCRHPDARAFLERAEPWLLEREIERSGPLMSARSARANDTHFERPTYWATIEDGGEIVGCAYRTPPYRVGVTALPTAALAPLTLSLEQTYRAVSGFAGVDPAASALADIWLARHGGASTIVARQFLMAIAHVPASAPGEEGALRLATREDAALALQWGDAAAAESGLQLDGRLCLGLIEVGQLYFYGDAAPRCMVGVLYQTPTAAGIGIVFTPEPERRKGYATAAVRAVARALAAGGRERRYFYLDPRNRGAQALCTRLDCELVQASVDIDFR